MVLSLLKFDEAFVLCLPLSSRELASKRDPKTNDVLRITFSVAVDIPSSNNRAAGRSSFIIAGLEHVVVRKAVPMVECS
jgi:hypothetical protein